MRWDEKKTGERASVVCESCEMRRGVVCVAVCADLLHTQNLRVLCWKKRAHSSCVKLRNCVTTTSCVNTY